MKHALSPRPRSSLTASISFGFRPGLPFLLPFLIRLLLQTEMTEVAVSMAKWVLMKTRIAAGLALLPSLAKARRMVSALLVSFSAL